MSLDAPDVRTGLDTDTLCRAVEDHLLYLTGRHPRTASLNDVYLAVAHTVRDRLFARGASTMEALVSGPGAKSVAYLSAEFLIGPQLGAHLVNLDIVMRMREALQRLGFDLYAVLDHEEEPGLGNGGLGRLAACYLESMATLGIPAIGYGIRYEFGIFDQEIRDGWQVEVSDKWLHWGNPWEVARPELAVDVAFGGEAALVPCESGGVRARWNSAEVVRSVPHDVPVLGYRANHCSALRLWRAEAVESFDLSAFNQGDYLGAVDAKVRSETISKVLYPNDSSLQGRALRLKQQYFFVSSSLQDVLRMHRRWGRELRDLPAQWAVQLNDTHPAIAVAELMRLLVDEYRMPWDEAWEVTVATTAYTNHTLLPEALETWPIDLFARCLPRHLAIIYEINHRFLRQVRSRAPHDEGQVQRLSLIDERPPRSVRMANLACVGSHRINGVAALHTELLKRDVLADWVDVYPERFRSITNGVTPRRFLALSNPGLAGLISSRIGDAWVRDLDRLDALEAFAEDSEFGDEWARQKRLNKVCLAALIQERTGWTVDPSALFDVHVKRIHEYKRQHLNVLHILTLYRRLKANPSLDVAPRVFLFGGKAAPGYTMAKLIIRLITAVADLVNHDPDIAGRILVVFFPDFNVKYGQLIYPAADLSEQISTAGTEASGTGNMKFAMNGAPTIGTLDGANIEIRAAVGDEHFFSFGLTAPELRAAREAGWQPRQQYDADPELRGALDLMASPSLAPSDPGVFAPIVGQLLGHDPYMLTADYRSYVDQQDAVGRLWCRPALWTRTSVLNVARIGRFSSDRSIREYCREVWDIPTLAGTDDVPAAGDVPDGRRRRRSGATAPRRRRAPRS